MRAAWIAVVRNPFDNVATMSLRSGRAYDRIRISATSPQQFRAKLEGAQARGGRVPAEVLPEMVEDYAALCEGVATVREQVPSGDWYELRHEELIADPTASLARLFAFLELPVTPELLRALAGSVSSQVNRTRHQLRWSADARERVEHLAAEHSFLEGYVFDGQ